MDIVRKIRFWRWLQAFVNVPIFKHGVDASRYVMNKLTALPTKTRDGDIPWTPFTKTLADSKIAVVNTAGLYLDGQEPFDIDAAKGDATFRTMPSDFDKSLVRIAHAHFPHGRAKQDLNVILPIDRLRELVDMGVLGGFAPNFYSFGFGGGMTREYVANPGGSAHVLARRLLEDQADFVLMVPT